MNILFVYLMQSCNLNCYYCTFKQWLRPLDFKEPFNHRAHDNAYPVGWAEDDVANGVRSFNAIRNEPFLEWVDAYCPPEKTFIVFTGGEPSLYKEIVTLIPALCDRGYYGFIQTNGLLYIPKTDNFKLITCWHHRVKKIPPYYDSIQIIKNPVDNWEKKVQYCEANKIPYKTVPFNYCWTGKSSMPEENTEWQVDFDGIATIFSMGHVAGCPSSYPKLGSHIFNMTPPVWTNCFNSCSRCGAVGGVQLFFDHYPNIKAMVENSKGGIYGSREN